MLKAVAGRPVRDGCPSALDRAHHGLRPGRMLQLRRCGVRDSEGTPRFVALVPEAPVFNGDYVVWE